VASEILLENQMLSRQCGAELSWFDRYVVPFWASGASAVTSQRKENNNKTRNQRFAPTVEQPLKKVVLRKILNLQVCGLFGGFSAFFGLAQGQIKVHDGPVTAVSENQLGTHNLESRHSEATVSQPQWQMKGRKGR
jgi:hypothetical protein